MSLREKLRESNLEKTKSNLFNKIGVITNPFPPSGQTSQHPRMESQIDDDISNRVRKFEGTGNPSQIILIEGTQGIGKTNLLNYYQQEFEDLYKEDKESYIIQYFPDPEPSFDAVIRRVFQGLNHELFKNIALKLSELPKDERNQIKDIALNKEVQIVLNRLERVEDDRLDEYSKLALEWFMGLRLLKAHREKLGVNFRLDTVESRTQALRDVVYVSERLKLLKGIFLLLDELEKQDYSLSKTPVLRFLSAIRALIDALPRFLFLMVATTPQAKQRYFAMLPAFQGRFQDILTLNLISNFEQAVDLYNFYCEKGRKEALREYNESWIQQGEEEIFEENELREMYDTVEKISSERGTEGITPRDFLHNLYKNYEKKYSLIL